MVDIVIVNWNSGIFLKKCIESILCSKDIEFVAKMIIIDNASKDKSIEILPYSSKIKILKNSDNNGFSKACNQGFKLCTAKYTLLLNPDAQLTENTLEQCVLFMNGNKTISVLGCALLDDNGKRTISCARFPTPLRFFYDATGLSKIAPTIFTPAILMTDWDHRDSRKVDQVMGAFMFMPTELFKNTGYFDERYFVYYEELDFSKRVASSGGCIYYNAEISAIHSGGGTTNDVKAFRLFLNLRSRLQYAKKHFTSAGYIIVWICTFVIEPVTRTVLNLLSLNFKGVKELLKGYKKLIVD